MNVLTILKYLLIILEVLFIFNLIIVVHELGHFLAARWRGLVVEEFGIWFGKPLWRKKFGGVWYSLGTIPAGGFVKLPQLAPMRTIEGAPETEQKDLPPIKPLDKIIVAFAGPLFSFLLALALACVVWKVGKPVGQGDTTTHVGMVEPGGPAAKAGMLPLDKILAVDGKPVSRFFGLTDDCIVWNIVASEGATIDFLIEREGKQMHIHSGYVVAENSSWRRKANRQVLIGPLIVPEVSGVVLGSPSAQAGLQKGDVITSVNGKPILSLDQVFAPLRENRTAPLALIVKRGEQSLPITITPGEKEEDPLGAEWGKIELQHPTPFRQVTDAVKAIGNMLRSVTSSKSDIKVQHFSGPVGIMHVYKRMLEDEQGWRLAIFFSVFFNVNLALINMLPLPVLDGGHITLGLLELIRRKPITNIRILEWLETGCTLAILSFLVYVTFFDIGDLVPKGSQKAKTTPPPAAVATPTPEPAPN